MSASKTGQRAVNGGRNAPEPQSWMPKLWPSEKSRATTRFSGCCADGMDVSTYTAVEGVGP